MTQPDATVSFLEELKFEDDLERPVSLIKPSASEQVVLRGSFAGTPSGVADLAEAVGVAVHEHGETWMSNKAGRLAFAASLWLLQSQHLGESSITAQVELHTRPQILLIILGDTSRALPNAVRPLPIPEWKLSLGVRFLDAIFHCTDVGRLLRCAIHIA